MRAKRTTSGLQRSVTARAPVLALALMLAFVAAAAGCSDDDSGAAADAAAGRSDGPCWYCVPDGATAEGGGVSDGASGKPDTGKGGGKDYVALSGDLDASSYQGSVTYANYGSGKTPVCSVTYAVASSVADASCAKCDFARVLTLGAVAKQDNPAKCTAGQGLAGARFGFGQGPSSKGGKGAWFKLADGTWKEAGSSDVSKGRWTFSFFGLPAPLGGGAKSDGSSGNSDAAAGKIDASAGSGDAASGTPDAGAASDAGSAG